MRRAFALRSCAAGALIAAALCVSASAETVVAENAWVPLAPATAKVHAGYMTLVNRGASEVAIVGATSPDYERIELHRSAVKDGMSIMETVGEVAIPANGRVAFEPTAMHFMLIGPKRAYAADENVRIVLRLRGGEDVGVSAVVKRRGAARADHSHHGHGHHGGAR